MKNKILESHHTVASYELDSFGHVNNAVFLNYLEKARCDFMTLKGLHFDDFFKWHRYPLVARAALEYKHPAKAGDKLLIKGWITKHTATSFTMQYEILHPCGGDNGDRLILTAETFHVFVDDNNRPARIPEEFLKKFIENEDN
ncbi:MAG: acyl-CoA thioester hydrolase [Acidobacteriota bacterium]|nr:acyl-CoA thioester hydrolase [Acidobacteriota bacterium]